VVEHTNDEKHERDEPGLYRLEFVGLTVGGDRPDVVVQALDRNNHVLHSHAVPSDGSFRLPDEVLQRAHLIVLGASDGRGGVRKDATVSYRAEEFAAQIKDGTLALAEGVCTRLLFHWTCVSGSVRACRRRPWWFDTIIATATTVTARFSANLPPLGNRSVAIAPTVPSLNDLIYWPYRCAPVCLGSVEVYRRICCCWPIVIDERIDDLIRDLSRYVEHLPKPPVPKRGPPPPPPPVGDPLKTPFFKGGALNELALNAASDLQMLRSLPKELAAQYVNSRPYLVHWFCSCDRPARVGTGTIQPDGSFNICWLEAWHLLSPHCHYQYAYVVKQTIGGTTTTIYDGLVAGAWFAAGDNPVLTSYSSQAFTCNETGTGDGDAYVFLDVIGDTESHELTTPSATGWDRVAAPDPTSGLLFPGVGPNNSHLRNLGDAIELTFIFSLGMRDASVGAHYYRVSICQADASGHPTGPRYYYGQGLSAGGDGLTWQKVVGADIVPETLGPDPVGAVGGNNYLYRIPYADEPWVGSVRHHALINTLFTDVNVPPAIDPTSPAVNHLVTLEVFNAAGERLRPLGTPASGQPGTELAKPFKYRRWFQPGGSVGDDTVEVPFAALTHLFCWDNRRPVADISRLVMDNTASDEECQFLEGPADSTFAVEYRAYVPDQRFQYAHDIGWIRGLNASEANGGVGSLPTPLSPNNAGQPPGAAVNSGSNTFELMLTRPDPPNPPTVLDRCSFAATLTTYAKTTNGQNLSYYHYAQEPAAFALAIAGA
jgi:hypothetical protein